MAEYYLVPKRLARRVPALGRAAQYLESALFRAVFWVMRHIPLSAAYRLSGGLFSLVGPHTGKAKKAQENLAVAFPESGERWRTETTRGIFRSLGYAAVELVRMDKVWERRDELLEFVIEPGAQAWLDSGRAAVMVTAHVGPWQAVNLIARQYGLKVSTIYAPESNLAMTGLMNEMRASFGVGWISSEEGVRPLLRELQDGNVVGMAMDTRLDSGKLIPFFGREALTNTSAAGLALRTGAALIPVRAQRLPGGRFRIFTYDPLVPADPDADPREQAVELTAQVNRAFESWIRETPSQWICLKRRWPKGHKL